jgi:hypothetical protein
MNEKQKQPVLNHLIVEIFLILAVIKPVSRSRRMCEFFLVFPKKKVFPVPRHEEPQPADSGALAEESRKSAFVS